MKKFMFALMGVMSLMLVACGSDDNDGGSSIKNFWTLTKESKTLYDNDTEGVQLTVTLAYTAEDDITLVPTLSGDGEYLSAFELSTSTVVIKKGQKTANFSVRAKENKVISKNGALSVGFQTLSSLNAGEAVSVSVAPKYEVELTEAQMQLIRKWQEAYGIDVRRFIGSLGVESTVTFNTDDKDYYNNGEETSVFTDLCPITISEKATEKDIVLRMEGNALGLRDFLYRMLQAQTSKDEDFWMSNTHNVDLLKAISFDSATEEFSVSLDVTVDPKTKSIAFVSSIENLYGDIIANVPFEFNYTAWNRQKKMADEGGKFIMDNGEESAEEITMAEAIEQGITLNPAYYLVNSGIDADQWEAEPSLYVKPTASYDDTLMTFTFPWDFMNASGYEKVVVKISLNE